MRKAAVPFYALIFLTEVVWVAIVPVAPTYAEKLSLSTVETGTVLAAAGIATVLVSLPTGLLADRIGARTLTLGSSTLMTVSTLGQGSRATSGRCSSRAARSASRSERSGLRASPGAPARRRPSARSRRSALRSWSPGSGS